MRTSFFVFQFITTVTNLPLRTSLKRNVSSSIQWAIAASWKFQHAVVVTGMNLLSSWRSTTPSVQRSFGSGRRPLRSVSSTVTYRLFGLHELIAK